MTLHGTLARALWQLGEQKEALRRLELGMRLDPGYLWAWGSLVEWAALAGE